MTRYAGVIVLLGWSVSIFAADSVMAIQRTNAENYKDRALAACISTAYRGSPAGDDADITKSIFKAIKQPTSW